MATTFQAGDLVKDSTGTKFGVVVNAADRGGVEKYCVEWQPDKELGYIKTPPDAALQSATEGEMPTPLAKSTCSHGECDREIYVGKNCECDQFEDCPGKGA